MSTLRHELLKLAHTNPELRDSLVPLLAAGRTAKTAGEFTEAEWKKHQEKYPGAKKEDHTIVKSKGDKGDKSDKVPKGVDLSGVKPEEVEAFAGEIPEYKIEIIAGGEGGEITEADLRRAKAVKAQLKRGIQAAADICKMSPPVCEGNFGVARSSMPQLSADESVKDMLKTDEQRIADMGDKWDDLSDEKKAKNKKDWATARKKGQAAVDAGADPEDDRTVFQQLLDSVAEEGTKISSQEPPFDKRPVGELKATQREIKAGKTYGIANAYLQGDYDPREAPIIISSDNHILDGHHRYSAMITADPDAKMNVIVVDMPMKKFLERSFEQPGVFRADLQDNIISSDDPLDLARDPGSAWQQKGKWYAKNKEGESSGPFKDKDGAEAYAKGKKKEDKPKKKASAPTLKGRLAKLAFDNPDMREALLPLLKESASSSLLEEIQNSMRRFIHDVNRKFRGDGYKRTEIEAHRNAVEGSERGLGNWYVDWEDVEDDTDMDDYDYERSSDIHQIRKYFENWMKKEPWYNSRIRLHAEDSEKQWIYFDVQVR